MEEIYRTNYFKELRLANQSEIRYSGYTYKVLLEILNFLNKLTVKSPNVKNDIHNFQSRISYLEKKLAKQPHLDRYPPNFDLSTIRQTIEESIGFKEYDYNSILERLLNQEILKYNDYLTLFTRLISDLSVNQNYGKSLAETNGRMVYYVGDTHGSYKEVIIVIKYLIAALKKSPDIVITFLGDYVDRNPQDLENLALISAFAMKYPNNVILLRGNHEDVRINEAYGFVSNLKQNFQDSIKVTEFFSRIIRIYTQLPLIHIHHLNDGSLETPINIIGVHGGIPVNINQPKKPVIINEITQKLNTKATNFEAFDTFMNWILWADPKEELKGVLSDPSTGRNQYGSEAFWSFMNANDYHFLVRAHEKWPLGYKYFFKDTLISLFSTSYYNDKKIGEAAFLRLEPNKSPKIIRIDEVEMEEDLNSTF